MSKLTIVQIKEVEGDNIADCVWEAQKLAMGGATVWISAEPPASVVTGLHPEAVGVGCVEIRNPILPQQNHNQLQLFEAA